MHTSFPGCISRKNEFQMGIRGVNVFKKQFIFLRGNVSFRNMPITKIDRKIQQNNY